LSVDFSGWQSDFARVKQLDLEAMFARSARTISRFFSHQKVVMQFSQWESNRSRQFQNVCICNAFADRDDVKLTGERMFFLRFST